MKTTQIATFAKFLSDNGFVKAPDSEPYDRPSFFDDMQENEFMLTERYIWNGKIEIGRYRMIYGYRLRVNYLDAAIIDLNICCGAQMQPYQDMFEKIVTIMVDNGFEDPLKGIPQHSKIKPYFNDDEFCDIIESLYLRCHNHTHPHNTLLNGRQVLDSRKQRLLNGDVP